MPLLLAGVAVLAGSALQGSTGLGLAQVAVPLLAMIDTRLIPVPITACGLVLLVLISARERDALNFSGLGWALAGCLPGTVAGAALVAAIAGDGLAIIAATVILVGVGLSIVGWAPRPTVPALLTAGTASGFMGSTTGAAGPPMALVYQRFHGAQLRATLSVFFIVGNVLALAALALAGQIHRFQLEATAWLLPFTVAGFFLSGPARRVVDHGYTRPAILGVSAASALALLIKAIL